MIKFLKTVFESMLIFSALAFLFLGYGMIFVNHNYDFKSWAHLFFWGGMTILGFWSMVSKDTPEEKAKTENNTDNLSNTKKKKESEVIVVTEIQGERKIIKDGKVIYSEKLKADELQVYEKLKDKN